MRTTSPTSWNSAVVAFVSLAVTACTITRDPETVNLRDMSSETLPDASHADMGDATALDGGGTDASIFDVGVDGGEVGGDAGSGLMFVIDESDRGGSHQGTRWNGGMLELAAGAEQGTYFSSVFDAGESVEWFRLFWEHDIAYGTALSDDGVVESFPGGLDLSANTLLLHLDGAGSVQDSMVIPETSGASVFVTASSAGVASYREAVFGPGIFFNDGTDHLFFDSQSPSVDFGTSDFTWSIFVFKSSPCGSQNRSVMGTESNPRGAHTWLGCVTGASCDAADGLGGTMHASNDDGVGLCTAARYVDGRWHHIALVKRDHTPGTITWYFDGLPVAELAHDWGGSVFSYDGNNPFTIGKFPNRDYGSETAVDEVAIFKRALSDEEIGQIARRGLAKISYRFRTCTDAACSGDPPWRGVTPGDDSVEALEPGLTREFEALTDLRGRYLQVAIDLSGRTSLTPRMLRSAVGGR